MTYREKLKKEYPECVRKEALGGCHKCPHTYGYCKREDTLCPTIDHVAHPDKCRRCWDQEIKTKIVKIPPDMKKEFKAVRAVFKDGHEETISYCSGYDSTFFTFATESGVYAWNDERVREYNTPGRFTYTIRPLFSRCHTYRDERGDLRTMYLDASDVDHVEFEEVEI